MINLNEKTYNEIISRYYFAPIAKNLELAEKKFGIENSISYLTEVMMNSTKEVESIIKERVKTGIIRDADQTRKAVAGNGFQALVAYSLIKLQMKKIIPEELIITLKPKKHEIIEKYATIQVGDEVQKPDLDLMIYSNSETMKKPIMIFSMKTSLRERVGQTYKWKLLMDIATAKDCKSIKNKYQISYNGIGNFKVGLITTNFYNEIMNPQQQGLLKFFDYIYLTKSGSWKEPVKEFSNIISELNHIYK